MALISATIKSFLQAKTKPALYALVLAATFYTPSAFALNLPNLQAMVTNLAATVPNLMRLVTACSYVMGMFMMIMAVMGMKHLGEMRTMQSREHGFAGPSIEFLVGAALIYLPSTILAGVNTFWVGGTNPYAYVTSSTDQYTLFVNACYGIINLIGVIAFMRGLLMLNQAGGERGQPGMFPKAISHMIGGILCINIYGTIQMLQATVGMVT
jgi:intracellular multiplication protein IcmC